MSRIGVAFAGGMSPPDIVACVKLAEELGYESAWIAEGHGGDQFSILSACAVQTERILLGTSISSVFVRSAPTIAMAAASVDHFSQGRLLLGLGSSHKVQVEPEHGIPYGKPVQRVRETVEVIRSLLRDGQVAYQGQEIKIDSFDLWFEPLRREIPIYLSAVFPRMLETCGEMAQGTLLVWSTLGSGQQAAEHVAAGARRAGRDPAEVDIGSLLSCSVSEDRREAIDRVRPAVAFYTGFFPRYNRLMAESGFPEAAQTIRQAWLKGDREGAARLVPDDMVQTLSIVGSAADSRRRLEAYRESGIQLPVIFPVGGRPDGKEKVIEAIRACAP